MRDALVPQKGRRLGVRLYHGHPRRVMVEMPLDQRQGALADRAQPDDYHRAVDAPVLRIIRHRFPPVDDGPLGARPNSS